MRVLVTGASGLIGRAAVRVLLEREHHVVALQRGAWADLPPGVEQLQADVTGPTARAAASAADAVLHLAARGDVQESWSSPIEYLQLVAGGTLNVLEGARAGGARLVLSSTQRVYRPARRPIREESRLAPADPYAVAKLAAEAYLRLYAERYHLATRAVRLFTVYGPGQVGRGNSGVVAIFSAAARAGRPLRVDVGPRRDLTFVDDAALGLCLALERAQPGFRAYNIATGQGTSLETLARLVIRLAGSTSSIDVPSGAWSGGDLVADLSRAQRELGYEPRVELEAGLRRLLGPG